MKKDEFLQKLKDEISIYPYEETKKSLEYYEEMINDRLEEGMTEDEAVASLGSVEDIAEQIKCELPITTIVKQKAYEKTKGEKIPSWVIILLILGCPLWISLIFSIGATILAIYVSIWSVALVLWVIDFVVGIISVISFFSVFVMLIRGSIASSVIFLGLSILCAGLAIFLYLASFFVSKGIAYGTYWLFKQIKRALVGKKEA